MVVRLLEPRVASAVFGSGETSSNARSLRPFPV
jgi:hypothetical protein